jgi:hypothetical protein
MSLDSGQILPRQHLLDIANQFASEGQYSNAASVYEKFITHYANYEHIEQVELMLGIIYSRYLEKPDLALSAHRREENYRPALLMCRPIENCKPVIALAILLWYQCASSKPDNPSSPNRKRRIYKAPMMHTFAAFTDYQRDKMPHIPHNINPARRRLRSGQGRGCECRAPSQPRPRRRISPRQSPFFSQRGLPKAPSRTDISPKAELYG